MPDKSRPSLSFCFNVAQGGSEIIILTGERVRNLPGQIEISRNVQREGANSRKNSQSLDDELDLKEVSTIISNPSPTVNELQFFGFPYLFKAKKIYLSLRARW